MSHFLQKSYDCELYAIVDVPEKQKNFFENQKFVNFKKIWYTLDNILKNHKLNIDNLTKFEKNYEINLWNMAINERLFYRFNLEKFSDDEILSILEQECLLFEKILDEVKPNFLITKWASRHYHQLLIELCSKKGIKILQLGQPKIGYKMLISENPSKIDGVNNLDSIISKKRNFSELQNFVKNFNMSKQQTEYDTKKQTKLGFLNTGLEYIFSKNELDENHYDYYFGGGKWKNIKYVLTSPNLRKTRKKFLDTLTEKLPEKPFVYFPLAVDMERNLLINAPFYTNQIELIRHIAKSLPINFTLVVKENPAQISRDWRPLSDYKEIMDIPNVSLISPNVSYDKILEKSSLIILIGGTTGFEAAFYGKPSIVFSDMIYSLLPSIFRIKNLEELPHLIKTALNYQPESDSLDKYLTLIEQHSFDFDYLNFLNEFNNIFFREDRLSNVDISASKMENFLDKNKSVLELVANEHIKKIEWHKKND
ncbi:MAG: hypothetical protein CMG15_00310 [Candidatus Marinimicrobia bacterium]|nr:hypothetical protein [Candidatus Neomarinimicrobiota bacterium]